MGAPHIDGLVIDDVRVEFGGLVAVAGLTMSAPVGAITGLIGPNGAGKSTTFNVCSGLVEAKHGSVSFRGHDLTRAPVTRRAEVGIGRTFQRMELFESLTVAENVSLGAEARRAGRSPVTQLIERRAERASIDDRTAFALRRCGIAELAGRHAGTLSTGERRLVELARCFAGEFQLLLLDEPSSGLDVDESKRFGELLRCSVADEGLGILIVEHDMSLIADTCDHVYVLDFGELIFEGAPLDVLSSPVVRAAYLGTEPIPEAATAG